MAAEVLAAAAFLFKAANRIECLLGRFWMGARILPILLLIGSNIFMTFAWYGHLKFKEVPLWKVILVSWGIALFEYCLQVPANRLGSKMYSPDTVEGDSGGWLR